MRESEEISDIPELNSELDWTRRWQTRATIEGIRHPDSDGPGIPKTRSVTHHACHAYFARRVLLSHRNGLDFSKRQSTSERYE